MLRKKRKKLTKRSVVDVAIVVVVAVGLNEWNVIHYMLSYALFLVVIGVLRALKIHHPF